MQSSPVTLHRNLARLAKPAPTDDLPPRALAVCIINPKFQPSFWGFDYALPLMSGDKRSWVVTGALPALAALAPAHCSVTLIDENIEDIDFEAMRHFDVIGVTGMIVQRDRMTEILLQLRDLPATVVVGGPYVTVAEERFSDLCDVVFIGEAEETWPVFLRELGQGKPVQRRYQQADKTDMQTVPAPRYDLVKAGSYVMASLQFSRGCPFQCEFCDIITIFGRKPRLKTPQQMIIEFDALLAAGFRSCFLVDDNFIGNKAKAKDLLRALVAWQKQHGYPMTLFTEASINLADDSEMIELMVASNFRNVFIGIETPKKESLIETLKHQNVRGDSLEDKVQRIRDGGLIIQAGFIVGFDADTESIFEEQFDFIQRSGIAQSLVSILTPIPTTPLYARLEREGRLDYSNPHVAFHPKGMSRESLKTGFDRLTRQLYEPRAYFERLFRGYAGSPEFRRRRATLERLVPARTARFAGLGGIGQAAGLAVALLRDGQLWQVGSAYVDVWCRLNRPLGREAIPLATFLNMCVVQWHFFKVSRMANRDSIGTVEGLPPLARQTT